MTVLDATQLLRFLSADTPRRLRVIENVLVGKRSVSTLYWGMRYAQLDWLGYDKKLSRTEVDQAAQSLVNDKLAVMADTKMKLTPEGLTTLNATSLYEPQAISVRLTVDISTFWQRFLLAIQVVSEASFENRQYYPLQVPWAVKQTIKRWFHQYREASLAEQFRTFLEAFLTSLPTTQANFLANLLVGHVQPGKTITQLAQTAEMSLAEATLIQTDLVCQLVQFIQQEQTPVFTTLLAGLVNSPVSQSALQTVQAYNQGQSLSTISQRRHLKDSTVREHLLEAAILQPLNAFDYERALSPALQTKLADIFDQQSIDEWQFDQVAPLSLEFWQFRLYEILRSKQDDQ